MGNNCCCQERDYPEDFLALKTLDKPIEQQEKVVTFEQKTLKASKSIGETLEMSSNVMEISIMPT